jgi:single-stranded-DNA-specific exonuclease
VSTPEAVRTKPTVPRQRWIFPDIDARGAAALAQSTKLPQLIADLLWTRGVYDAAAAEQFLNPTFDQLLDPYTMLGMDRAVTRIQQAAAAREPILIYGDYDVDGTTAVVLLKTAIEMLGGVVRFHVPHRLREGYGMQREILEIAAREGVRLVISVDTGIRAFAAAEAAETLGLDLIVTDHHLPEASLGLPRALAVLNPNQAICGYACKHLCGAGVAFKLSQALLEAHDRERARTKILPSFLKLLAIATIADAVPLLGENRVIVALGLEELRRPVHAGLRALMQVAQLDPAKRKLTPVDVGFRLAPRINAAGRMDVASEVVELFTTKDADRAQQIAEKLEQLNQDRRAAEAAMLTQILARMDEPQFQQCRCVVIDGDGWHRGIIGILASRIVDQTGKPAIVIAHEDGEAYGSGRSIAGFHLLNAIETCHDLFTRFGGHSHAVGFSLPSARVDQLRTRLDAYAASNIAEDDLGSPLPCHSELALEEVTRELHGWLKKLEPCGMDNEEPIFITRNVRMAAPPRVMKERHISLLVAAHSSGSQIRALGWNWAERIQAMQLIEGAYINLAYRVRENEHPDFGGLELEIAGIQLAVEPA